MTPVVSFIVGVVMGAIFGAVVVIILALAAAGGLDDLDNKYDESLELTQEEIEK